ncbi:zinc ribbon domain-containing protein [Chromohalobacter nigrandesensis]|uniref:zinc ribbon domain-containing protein n=1 Tax=Chromohalobacter nigrandesensis TaxID=119863 RepID=UPI001FF32ADE|nr:zinc ribbon domain-containing protein [Chromohalobacter nigrandesensis]MCK0744131.1 zinc ribbon domain-containing protein [Chromohalobacter nigrandesensis]
MALISCPECDHQVSDTALKCSQCGMQLRKPRRSIIGKFFKWGFILFNLLMAIWMFSYFGFIGESMNGATSEAEQAGTAIGSTLGVGMLLVFWALGDVILGLFVMFTRPKS